MIYLLRLFLIVLCFSKIALYAQQPLVGVYNSTFAISPSYTVSNNTSFTLTGMAINVGTVTINSNVHANMAIDTSSFSGIKKYYWRKTVSYPVTNFLPNATFNFAITDVASDVNGYKVDGGGTTVIVWFSVGLPEDVLSCADTAMNTIYVLPTTQNLQEFQALENELKSMVNPITENIEFINAQGWKIELIDVTGKTCEISKFDIHSGNNQLKISNYAKGLYLLKFTNDNGMQIAKKIIFN